MFAADKTSPNLGYVNCEDNQVLCATWSAGAPTVWVFEVPRAQVGEERPATPLYIVNLNTTAVTSEGIFKIHSQKNYQARPAYEGIMHPTDGFLARTKLNIAMGYVIYGLGMIPNWLFMIGISFMSRTLM